MERRSKTWDLSRDDDARQAYALLTSVVRALMPWADEHDRMDVVSEAMASGLASRLCHEMTPAYLRHLARAARNYHIIGGRKGRINELEFVVAAKVDAAVERKEQLLGRHLTPTEVHDIAARLAGAYDTSRTHRAVRDGFMERRRRTVSLEATLTDDAALTLAGAIRCASSAAEFEAVLRIDDPVDRAARDVEAELGDPSWAALSRVDRKVVAWEVLAGRRDAPYPVRGALSTFRRRSAATLVAEAGGALTLAMGFHESDAGSAGLQALFAPFARADERLDERQRTAVADTLGDFGTLAQDVWTACATYATRVAGAGAGRR